MYERNTQQAVWYVVGSAADLFQYNTPYPVACLRFVTDIYNPALQLGDFLLARLYVLGCVAGVKNEV